MYKSLFLLREEVRIPAVQAKLMLRRTAKVTVEMDRSEQIRDYI